MYTAPYLPLPVCVCVSLRAAGSSGHGARALPLFCFFALARYHRERRHLCRQNQVSRCSACPLVLTLLCGLCSRACVRACVHVRVHVRACVCLRAHTHAGHCGSGLVGRVCYLIRVCVCACARRQPSSSPPSDIQWLCHRRKVCGLITVCSNTVLLGGSKGPQRCVSQICSFLCCLA